MMPLLYYFYYMYWPAPCARTMQGPEDKGWQLLVQIAHKEMGDMEKQNNIQNRK